ncbi:PAS domain-containing protein [Methylobacterium sp. NEAU 140]|uniref:PAS domain-containing protein n=1 Tax=Methylobacterium sp. NEAU 140 TaxID=3064945 RepID=UPI00273719F7|nr:PAS domain-containing protein [Methylobacterium sp. NEAU 140]MDP4021732.1 PAS domain-containing protein [Methylobacterium sp. NEAU 140]
MKHPTSRKLHAYWERLRGERSAPERAEIEPGEIRHLLADSLILELDMAAREATVRLAGTRVCALYGRELKGLPFAQLWGSPAAEPWRLVEIVAQDTLGVVAGLRGTNAAGESLDLELLLLPLRHRGRTQIRALGTLTPEGTPHWIGLRPLARADTTSLRILARPEPADVRPDQPPANDTGPMRRGHLLVHTGGRA